MPTTIKKIIAMKSNEEILNEAVGEKGFFSVQEKRFIHKAMTEAVNQALDELISKSFQDGHNSEVKVITVDMIIDLKNKLNGE